MNVICRDYLLKYLTNPFMTEAVIIQKRYHNRLRHERVKVKMELSPEIMNEVFDIIESPYPLRNELPL